MSVGSLVECQAFMPREEACWFVRAADYGISTEEDEQDRADGQWGMDIYAETRNHVQSGEEMGELEWTLGKCP